MITGVKSLPDLRARCWCDPDTDCWHWRMSRTKAGAAVVFITFADGVRRKTSGRRAALFLSRGIEVPAHKIAFATERCKTPECCNPEHCRIGTKAQHGKYLAKHEMLKVPSKIAAARRVAAQYRTKYSESVCEQIRRSDGPVSEIARHLGVNLRTAQHIRSGASRPQRPPSSVFDWAGRLDVGSRAEAAVCAAKGGLV